MLLEASVVIDSVAVSKNFNCAGVVVANAGVGDDDIIEFKKLVSVDNDANTGVINSLSKGDVD